MLDFGFFKMPTDLFLLILAIFLILVQLLLCLKAKSKIIRLIPIGLFVLLTAVFGALIFVLDGWDSIGCLVLAIWSALMALACGIGFGVWWIIRKKFGGNK